jgi:hypothetical protein
MSPNYGNIVFQDTTWPHGSLLNSSIQPNSGKILLKGPNADIDINGTSLTKMLDEIQTRLNILTVRPELEAEWDELKRLGQQYRKLEAEILAKQKTFDLLAKNN